MTADGDRSKIGHDEPRIGGLDTEAQSETPNTDPLPRPLGRPRRVAILILRKEAACLDQVVTGTCTGPARPPGLDT
jgi:hypothetical protein